jgi:hypothetical protein
MKRTHSGDLSLNPSPTSSNNGATNNRNQNQQQQADANRQRAPAMQAPAANDPAPQNPWLAFDPDEELLDWDKFAQMLPHTPPVENRRATSEEEASSVSDDEYTTEESSAEEPSRDFEEGIGTKISAGLKPEQDTIVVYRSSVRELIEILDFCKLNPQITTLKITPLMDSPLPLEAQEKLIEFFSNYQSIRELRLEFTSAGTASIQPKQLAALIQSGGLKALSVQGVDLISPSPEDSEEFFDGIKRNSSLEILDLYLIRNSQLVAGIIDAMAEGKILKRLDLTTMKLNGIGNSIARLLTSNTNLRALKINAASGQCLDEVKNIFTSIAHNHTLEILNFPGSGPLFDFKGKNLLKLLALNQGLKEIRLPDFYSTKDEEVAELTELINTHPTLTSIDIGCIATNHQDRMSIAHALKSNPRITKIAVNLLGFYTRDISESERPLLITEFLNTIGDCPSLTALSIESLFYRDFPIQFLETHPQISEIALPSDEISSADNQEKLLALVRGYPHIKTFTIRNPDFETEREMQFRKELWQALAINREVGSDIRMAEASGAMKALLDKKSMTDEELPFVPLDVTNELTKAITRHLPSAKAKAIFDELILHAPVHQ